MEMTVPLVSIMLFLALFGTALAMLGQNRHRLLDALENGWRGRRIDPGWPVGARPVMDPRAAGRMG